MKKLESGNFLNFNGLQLFLLCLNQANYYYCNLYKLIHMKKLYLMLIGCGMFLGVNAQITYGFDYKENFQNFTHKDQNSAIVIALYNSNLDSTTQPYSAILSVVDKTSNAVLTAENTINFNMQPQQKVEFAIGQKGYRNEIQIKINPIVDNAFWGQKLFQLNLTTLEGFTADNLAYGHQFITVVIDYDGTKIGVPRVDKSNFTVYPNPTKDKVFVEGVNVQNIQVMDMMGKIVLEQTTPGNEINIENLPTGMYSLHAMSDKGLVVQKIVKN